MANLSAIVGGLGVQSIQTGHLDGVAMSSGSGEDERYYNVTISTVVVEKCVAFFQGSVAGAASPNKSGSTDAYEASARVTSTTQLRISAPVSGTMVATGRWYVVEFY